MNETSSTTDVQREVEELEELLVGLEAHAPMQTYSEEDDAPTLSMAAPVGERDWMVQYSPLDRKMLSTDRLLAELESGAVSENTLIWRGGMDEWVPIGQVEELARARRSAPRAPAAGVAAPPSAPEQGAAAADRISSVPGPARLTPLPPSSPATAAPSTIGSLSDAAPQPGAATPLMPSPPAPLSAAEAQRPALVAVPPPPPAPTLRSNVAVPEFAPSAHAPLSLKQVLGAGALAVVPVLVSVLALARGGVFETREAPSARSSALRPAATPGSAAVAAEAPGTTVVSAPSNESAPLADSPSAAAEAPEAVPPPQARATAAPPAGNLAAQTTDDSAATTAENSATTADQGAASSTATAAIESEAGPDRSNAARPVSKPRRPVRARQTASRAAPASSEAEPRAKPSPATAEPAAPQPAAAESASPAGNATPGGLDRKAAQAALASAAAQAGNCRPPGGPTGSGRVQVRYEPSGKVGAVSFLTPGFENTTTGSCVQMVFRRARVAPFSGGPVVLSETFEIR